MSSTVPPSTPDRAPSGADAQAGVLAIAGFKQVYSTGAVESALDDLPPNANEALRVTYEKMIRAGGERFTVKPGTMPDFGGLEEELPNFGEVLGDLRRQVVLCLETDDLLEPISPSACPSCWAPASASCR